jgi:hypothetical protein
LEVALQYTSGVGTKISIQKEKWMQYQLVVKLKKLEENRDPIHAHYIKASQEFSRNAQHRIM